MKTWIALLKGINVGGNNKILMKDLALQFGALGFSDVKTYIQSGNVVFRAAAKNGPKLGESIAAMIQTQFNIKTAVMVLNADQLSAAIDGNPFPEILGDEQQSKLLHLYFLAAPPAQLDLARLNSIKKPDERWECKDQVFYLHTPQGAGDSKLAMQVEKIVGVTATARNLRTALALQQMTS